ncbi:universal stress protein [Actinosynnema sp. NPDC023794]
MSAEDPDVAVEVREGHAREALEHLRARVRGAPADHPGNWTYHASDGDPVRLLVTVAEEQDALVVVVGTHRHRSLTATLLDRVKPVDQSRVVL